MLQKNAFGQKWHVGTWAQNTKIVTGPRVCQIQDLCRKKYKKGIFSDVQWWKKKSTHFSDSTHQECMVFARIVHGPCYYQWNDIFAGVTQWFIPIILFCSLKFELEIQIFNELYIVLLLDILPWWTQLGTLGHPGWLEFRDFTKFLWNHIIRTMAAAAAARRTTSVWRRRRRRRWAVSRNSRSAPTAAVRWRHYRGGISFLWLYIFRESYPSTKRW